MLPFPRAFILINMLCYASSCLLDDVEFRSQIKCLTGSVKETCEIVMLCLTMLFFFLWFSYAAPYILFSSLFFGLMPTLIKIDLAIHFKYNRKRSLGPRLILIIQDTCKFMENGCRDTRGISIVWINHHPFCCRVLSTHKNRHSISV